MIKYLENSIQILLSECPDEIALGVSLTSCGHKCKGCHSPELQEDTGTILTTKRLQELIEFHKGISAVCFLGHGNDVEMMCELINTVRANNIKVCLYSGYDFKHLDKRLIKNINYLKVGSYVSKLGGLREEGTNQKFFKVVNGIIQGDLTYRFQDKKHVKLTE